MLIKTPTSLGVRKVEHTLGRKVAPGVWEVIHPVDCECQMLHSVSHAPWVSYDQMRGVLFCDHCKTTESAPCPAVKDKVFSRRVKMDVEAIADQIWRFQLKHENCQTQSAASADNSSPAT